MEDPSDPKELDRRKFLEEVRRKAEEAELKRLDEEEQRIAPRPPADTTPSTPSKEDLALDQKVSELHGRLNIALDRGKLDRASEILDELSKLSMDESEILQFQNRIEALQTEQERAREAEYSAKESGAEEDRRRRIVELLESAGQAYQYEQYDRGLEQLREILSVDPGNASALDLQKRIEAAQRLSEQIKEEEARRKAEDERLFAAKEKESAPPSPKETADAWGSMVSQPAEQGIFAPGEENRPSGPPRQTMGQRIAEAVSDIHIPPRIIITVAACIVVAVAAYLLVEHIQNVVPLSKYSVLILPATSTPPDSGSEYVAAGLTDDLISALSSIPELRVIGAPTSRSFRGSKGMPLQCARTVGANYVLQWSLAKSQAGVTIQLSLSDTASQQVLLESQIQNSLRELPALRLEIARVLLEKMGISRQGGGSEPGTAPSSSVASAYDAYLKGRSFLERPDSSSLRIALASFETACREDSNFADAFTALAWTRIRMYEERVDTTALSVEKAIFCIGHAEALSSGTSEFHRARGMIDEFENAYGAALHELERAVEVAPSDAESQRRLSMLYVAVNRPDDALKAAHRAVADDPRNAASFTHLGLIQQWNSDLTDALNSFEMGTHVSTDAGEYAGGQYADLLVYTQQSDRAIEILSDRIAANRQDFRTFYRLGRVYQLVGKRIEGQRILVRAKDLLAERLRSDSDDVTALIYEALVLTRLGEYKGATAAVVQARRIGGTVPEVLYAIARAYAIRREKKEAIDYLSQALDRRFSLSAILDMDFNTLRSEPEFLRMIPRH